MPDAIFFYWNDFDKTIIYKEGKYKWKFSWSGNCLYIPRDFILAQLRRVISLVKLFVTASNVSYRMMRFVNWS
jgi:hypothetical protein